MTIKAICNETQEVFPSLREAAEKLGLKPSYLSSHIKYGYPYKVGGYTFTKLSDGKEYIDHERAMGRHS